MAEKERPRKRIIEIKTEIEGLKAKIKALAAERQGLKEKIKLAKANKKSAAPTEPAA